MNYDLNNIPKNNTRAALNKMLSFMKTERRPLIWATLVMILNAAIAMATPYMIGYTIDHYIETKQYHGLMVFSLILLGMYLVWAGTEYLQTQLMGSVGQRMLYRLRNEVFGKLQRLPVSFFNQNKSGDLISRINNDTDKVNQFFSQSLMRFMDSIFTMIGAATFLIILQPELGGAALTPSVLIIVFVLIVSPWVKRKNTTSLNKGGSLSAEIQESLSNFKTIIAFNRRDYFRDKLNLSNKENYTAAIHAGLANNIFMPVFTLFSNIAQVIVLAFGIYLIIQGHFTVGLLISFIAYANNFYQPLRQLAALWASFQTAMAAWDRISVIINLESNMSRLTETGIAKTGNVPVLQFHNVSFGYESGKKVLNNISFDLEKGKTYALVGPTGGGKTTTASLMARLFDPTSGTVFLNGTDIRGYDDTSRTKAIGFILQEPFLFSGSLKDNILYGNEVLNNLTHEQLLAELAQSGLSQLLARFEKGLDTPIAAGTDSLSLGQKQIIAFIRAVLRRPEILVLDEATANIDTVTEKILSDILEQLPRDTTKVVIAHRLNTIENADEIFFVNGGNINPAGSLDNAINMLLEEKRVS